MANSIPGNIPLLLVQDFVIEYVSNGYDHRAAAASVGFPAERGIRMLRSDLVREKLAELSSIKEETGIITKGFVEHAYLKLMPKLMGEEEVPLVTPAGEEYMACKFHSGEVVSVLRDLSKISGYMKPEESANKSLVNIIINPEAMSGKPIIDVVPNE